MSEADVGDVSKRHCWCIVLASGWKWSSWNVQLNVLSNTIRYETNRLDYDLYYVCQEYGYLFCVCSQFWCIRWHDTSLTSRWLPQVLVTEQLVITDRRMYTSTLSVYIPEHGIKRDMFLKKYAGFTCFNHVSNLFAIWRGNFQQTHVSTGQHGGIRSSAIPATPDDGTSQGRRRRCQHSVLTGLLWPADWRRPFHHQPSTRFTHNGIVLSFRNGHATSVCFFSSPHHIPNCLLTQVPSQFSAGLSFFQGNTTHPFDHPHLSIFDSSSALMACHVSHPYNKQFLITSNRITTSVRLREKQHRPWW